MASRTPTRRADRPSPRHAFPLRGGRRPSPWGILEVAIYVGIAFLLIWPVTFHLNSRFVGWRDAHYDLWLTWRVGELLRHGQLALHIPDVIWPYGSDVRLLDGQLPAFVGGLWQAIASPFLAFNLGLVTASLANMWAGRRIAKLFTNDRAVWIFTALAFATAPAIAARLVVHFTMYYAFTAALIVEEGIRVARGDRPLRPVRLAVLLLLAYLCSVYYLVFGVVAFGVMVLTSSARSEGLARTAARLSAGLVLVGALLLPFAIPRLSLDRAERAHGREPVLLDFAFRSGADALSIVAQPATSTLDLPGESRLREHFRTNVHESTIFPGFLLLGALSGLVLLRGPLRRPLLLSTLTLWFLSLGPSLKIDGTFLFTSGGRPVGWMPYTGLFALPGFASLRSPNRASFTIAAVLAGTLAMSMTWLLSRLRLRRHRLILSVTAAGLLATNLLIPVEASNLQGTASFHRGLEQVARTARPGQSMVEVPADCTFSRLLWSVDLQILHRAPLVGCQASPSSIPWASGLGLYHRSRALAGLRCRPGRLGAYGATSFTARDEFGLNDVADLRRELGVRYYLVDRYRLRGARCRQRLGPVVQLLASTFDVLGSDRRWMVIDAGPEVTGHPGSPGAGG
jgi:hypothetical protein